MAKEKDAKEKEPVPLAAALLGLVGRATEADLGEIDAGIAEKEKELAGLRAMRRVVALALGKEEPKKPGPAKGTRPTRPAATAAPAPAGEADSRPSADERRLRCARYILKNGPTTGAELGRLFGIPTGSQTHTFTHPWFAPTRDGGNSGYDLTPAGRAAVQKQVDD